MRRQVERLCDGIEAMLCARGVPGRIVGGVVGPHGVRLDYAPAPMVRLQDVSVALGGVGVVRPGAFGVVIVIELELKMRAGWMPGARGGLPLFEGVCDSDGG